MSNTSDMLFNYLREIFYDPCNAALDIEKLDDDFVMLGKGLVYFAQCFSQYNEFAKSLARGDLSVPLPPPENELTAPLKSLHASLKHLTWQSQQVAKGNYNQRVDFMGEFADAFNTMIEQLSERQQKLEAEIEFSQKKTKALEQSNHLLSNITQYIPQQIFVIETDRHEILLMNDTAKYEAENDPDYLTTLIGAVDGHKDRSGGYNIEIQYNRGKEERYLSVSSYFIEWNKTSAEALVISDISAEKSQMKELESHAYRDAMTQLYNRFYGMRALDAWLDEKKRFALVFLDLDNLKYINDKYGHIEGDKYIINTAKHLKNFSRDALVCRVGGDEFMLLVPDVSYDEAYARMNDIHTGIQSAGHLENKDYFYSVSFGIIVVGDDNNLSSSDVLSIADERMYEHKRMRKKARQ